MMRALPAYDLGPGREGDELVVNLILYGMALALVLSMLWVLVVPMVQTYLARRRGAQGASGSSQAASTEG